jgi:spermidine/putrescine transport system substrate-binding protein
VEKALKQLKANAKMLWTAKDDFSRAFDNGSVTGGTVYGSLGGQMVSEGKAVTYKIPKEGGVGFVDNWAVVKGTTKADLAHQWIDYMISKQFQGKWASKAEWSSPVPGNKSAVTSLDAAATQRLQIEDIGIMSKLTMEKYLPPKQLQAWTDLWNRVKAS